MADKQFKVDKGISKRLAYPADELKEIRKRRVIGNKPLYSSGCVGVDEYLFGGFGMPVDYEMVLIYGETGIGKSTVALNFLRWPIQSGVKIGIIALEDKNSNVSDKLSILCEDPEMQASCWRDGQIRLFPQEAKQRSWSLDELLIEMEDWFKTGIKIILLDHLQFAFDSADSIKGETEIVAQRVFMKKLNILVTRCNGTVIVVSHINKGSEKGLSKVQGSHAIVEIPTKVVEVSLTDGGQMQLWLKKTRWTPKRFKPYDIDIVGYKMLDAVTRSNINNNLTAEIPF